MSIQIEMANLMCFECGCAFAIPLVLFQTKAQADGLPIYCPNGHENLYQTSKSAAAEKEGAEGLDRLRQLLQETRQELTASKEAMVELRHRAEMAEAKAGVTIAENPVASDLRPVIYRDADGRACCPHCDAGYKLWACLRNHLRRSHGDDALADRMYDMEQVRLADRVPDATGAGTREVPSE